MKLMIIILRPSDDENVVQELIRNGFRVTRMASTGGFLKRGNVTLLIGCENDKVDTVINLIRSACCPPDNEGHRATVFVADMPYYAQI